MPGSARELARGFVGLFLEVEAGLRPRQHITGLMCPLLVARLEGAWVRPGPAGRLVRLQGSRPAPRVYEAVAVVRRGDRFGAIGVRLARRAGGWRVEDVARPEVGPLPPTRYPVPLDEHAPRQESATPWRRSQDASSEESG